MFVTLQIGLYYCLSLILGLIFSIVWAVVYAVLQAVHVWIIHPTIKVFFTGMRLVFIINKSLMRSVLDPVFQAVGLIFSYGRLKVSVDTNRRHQGQLERHLIDGKENKQLSQICLQQV